ncbi:MAG: hypothetical protein WBP13_00250 [Methylophilaceae bacterium]
MTDHSADNQKNLIPSFICGTLLAGMLVIGVGAYSGWWLQGKGSDFGLLFLLLILVVAAFSFLIANIALTMVHIKQKAAWLAYLLLWAPTLLSLVGLGAATKFMQLKKAEFAQNHPDVTEWHINLSGKNLWIEGFYDPLPIELEQFLEIKLYASSDLEKMKAYEGSHLAKSFKNMSFYVSDTPSAENKAVFTLPVVQASTYPDVTSLLKLIKADALGVYNPAEANLWVYQYFYYPDHVEIVPAINLSGNQSMALWGSQLPVVAMHVVSLQEKSLARIEVDGSSLYLGEKPWLPEAKVESCSIRNYKAFMINPFNAPVKVRWQFAEANPQWHEAVVNVPKLNSPKAKPDWNKRMDNVYLYFQHDGTVAAQWQQEVTFKGGQLGVRTTAVEPALSAPAPCGTAENSWDKSIVHVAN